MATKSFVKNVNLHGKKECQAFIRALERSDSVSDHSYPIDEQVPAKDMSKDVIQKMFCAEGEQ
jgi:hypothetical protein